MREKVVRERYNTKLQAKSREKLRLLTAQHGFKYENEMIEYMIENWGNHKNDMEDEYT